MTRRPTTTIRVLSGFAIVVVSALLPARWLAGRALPVDAGDYYDSLLAGIWCLKAALAVNGLLLLAWPFLGRLWGARLDVRPNRPVLLSQPSGWDRWDWVIALLLFVAALALRCINLGQSLVADEVAIQQMFVDRGLPVIMAYMPSMPHHVLYSVMVYVSELLPLPLEVAYRLPAMLFGAAAVPLIYRLARTVFRRTSAAAVGVLCAVSLFAIAHAQMGKSYSVTLFVVPCVVACAVGILRDLDRGRMWLGLGIGLGMLVFLHLYNVYLAAGLVLALCLVFVRCYGWGRQTVPVFVRRLLVVGLVCGAILFLVYSLMLPQVLALAEDVKTQPEERLSIEFFRGWLMQATFWGDSWPVALTCAGLACVGAVFFWRREPNAALLGVVPVVFLVAWVAVNRSFIYPRYLVFAFPLFAALCVEAVGSIGRFTRRRVVSRVGVIAFSLVFVAATVPSLLRYYRFGHQNLRAAAHLVESKAGPNDAIAAYGLCRDEFPFYAPRARTIRDVNGLDSLLESTPQSVYLLIAYPGVLQNQARDWEYIQDTFQRIRHYPGMLMDSTREDGDVLVFVDRGSLLP